MTGVGLQIKLARIARGEKQYVVAQKSNLHPSIYNLIENGKREPKPDELAAILRVLCLKRSEVQGGIH